MKEDISCYKEGKVTIIEVMGRDAGWITAGSKLACLNGKGPDLIYLPEVTFDYDRFLQEVSEIYKKLPTSQENIIRFLSSSQFKGIGLKRATAIYEYLKDDCISILINNPEIYDELITNKIIKESQNALILRLKLPYDFLL